MNFPKMINDGTYFCQYVYYSFSPMHGTSSQTKCDKLAEYSFSDILDPTDSILYTCENHIPDKWQEARG